MERKCFNCSAYLTDEDSDGNVTDFWHNRNAESGFCAMRELFYTVEKSDKPCKDYVYDGGEDCQP